MKVEVNAGDGVPDELRPYLVGERPRDNGEWDMFCPLHEDNNRSAQFNVDNGVWYCHACETGGTVRDLLRKQSRWVPRSAVASTNSGSGRTSSGEPEALEEARVKRWATALLDDELRLTELCDLRGLLKETIAKYEIGWDDVRRSYTIPVRNVKGELVNIRRYQPNPKNGRRKMWSANGHGSPWLYPMLAFKEADRFIIVCEGEWDALVTNQHGFPAVTRTASAGTWNTRWNVQFKDKIVLVCHDADKAGQVANEKVVAALEGQAREVRIIKLPYKITHKDGKDLSDWWSEHDGDVELFREMLRDSKQSKVVKLKLKKESGIGLAKASEEAQQAKSNLPGRLDITSLTDDGNAKRFIEQNRGRLIFAPGVGWFRWSRQHFSHDVRDRRMWREITNQQVEKDVKRTLRALLQEAVDMEDRDDQARAFKWAVRCRSQVSVTNCRKMAESGDPDMPDLTVGIEQLDQDPDLLNTASGIVDLRTGKLTNHDPLQFCTHITRAPFNPNADRRSWQKFLNTVMPDKSLQKHLQLCMGASITGHSTRGLFVLYGPEGENGKTQMIESIADTLGTYSSSSMESTFVNASSREAGYDLARMRGVRFVSFSETREGHGLASERVKRITGDDTIDARNPYGRPFSYKPQFSLWVGTNHAPFVPAWETAMWKRIRVWPMFEVIPKTKQIPDFGRWLARKHGAAILSWLIDGARLYYMNDQRLGTTPTTMEDQRSEWMRRDDIIGRWLAERTQPLMTSRVSFKALWTDFGVWCEQEGEMDVYRTYTARKFHEEMDKNHPYPRGGMSNGYATRAGLLLKGGVVT